MKRHSSTYKVIICFTGLVIVISAGCSATPAPEQLELINGEIDSCLLINSTEVETILGIKVTIEILPLGGLPAGCLYRAVTDDRVVLQTLGFTDAALKRTNRSYSAVEWYEFEKVADLNMSDVFKVEDINNFGDQAYLTDSSLVTIHVLKNKIYYEFSTRTVDVGGIGYDALIKLAKIALRRMP